MSEEVACWLEGLGLGQYADSFADNAIDADILGELSDADLEKIGVKLGHRKRLLKAIAERSTAANGEAQPLTPSDDDSLAAWERHPGERKPVTLLFADITGSTSLTEKLDPEETHELIYGAVVRMCEAVESSRGTVCRFMGDGVMAMFGAPVASEYHAADACAAAFAMQQSVAQYAHDIESRHGSGLQIRIGLHSGEVVVLSVGEGDKVEYDASGPAVPVAARLEQIAAPGEVYLSGATQALASARIEAELLEPVMVKGISEPVPVFALRDVRPADEAQFDYARTPFVGRVSELRQFTSLMETSIEEGHGQSIYVRGEPGIGKTRLVTEFARIAVEAGVSTHRGLVLPFGVGKGQDAVRSIVRSLLDIAPGSDKEVRGLAAARALDGGRLSHDQAVYVFDLLDMPQPLEQRALYDAMDNATRNAGKQAVVSALLTARSYSEPVLIIVEDVHWADTITLTHLSVLASTVADCPALLVMTSRIEGDQLDASWRSTARGSPLVTVDLGPLREEESMTLIREYVDESDPVAADCLQRASGNPLFLEQLLLNSREGAAGNLPDSIQSLVLARMDRLHGADKRALQAASVVGQRFDPEVLNRLLETDDYDCSQLVEHNLVRPDDGAFLFTHALVQESVYNSLVKDKRRELHGKAADCFQDSDLVLCAEHLAQAADERAPQAFLRAAREQAEHYRLEKALTLVLRGLELATTADRFPLQCLRGELLRSLGSAAESIEVYRSAKLNAASDIERCRASLGIAEGLLIVETYEELFTELQFTEEIAAEHGLSLELARVYLIRGSVCFLRGEVQSCIEANQTALGYAEAAGSAEIKADTLSGLGDAEYLRGRMISAFDYFERCVAICREEGIGKTLPANLTMRGAVAIWQSRHDAARRDFREALALSEETGQSRAELITLYAGECLAEWGDLDEGEQWLQRRLALARRLGARAFEGQSLTELSRIAYARGDQDEAEQLANAAVETLRDGSMAFAGPQALGTLALVTRDPDKRRAALVEGERLLSGDSVSHNYLRFYLRAMETCLDTSEWDEVERYAQALEDYTRDEPLPYADFRIAVGRSLAALGRGNRDRVTLKELERLRDEARKLKQVDIQSAIENAVNAAA